MNMNKEILSVAKVVSDEKGVDKDLIFKAIEDALGRTTIKAKHLPADAWVKVVIDRKTGNYDTFRCWEVVSDEMDWELVNDDRQLFLSDAKKKKSDVIVGDVIEDPIESIEFSRIAAQAAKQIIVRKVREAERVTIADRLRRKAGHVITAVVRRVTREHVILDVGEGAEGLLTREEMLPKESFRTNDRVKVFVYDVRADANGPLVLLSRTRKEMLVELFRVEVPEINEGILEIKASARDPGSRSKIAVKTNDGRIDPIGACVGMRGSRVQAVSNELGSERVDIILWDDNPAQLVINAMSPAQVSSILVDEETHTIDIAVREDQLSLAIGRNGQNVRLASELTGWKLNVMTEAEAAKKVETESRTLVQTFIEALDVDEVLADLLVQEGFTSLEEVAYVPAQEMLAIAGFELEIVRQLQARAQDALLTRAIIKEEQFANIGPTSDLLALPGMTREIAVKLAEHKILSCEDLAEQSVDDLLEAGLDEKTAAGLIMAARAPWFEEEKKD